MRRLVPVIGEIVINVGLPLLIYDQVAPASGDVVALIASAVPPLVWSLIQLIYRRRLDAISMLVLAGVVLSVLATLGAGSARFLQLREHLVTAVIGLVFLGSVTIGRPLIYHLASATMARSSPDALAAFVASRDRPGFRRVMTVMTLVWGAGLIASSALASVLVLTVSVPEMMIYGPMLSYATYGALGLWTAWYRRTARRRGKAASVEGIGETLGPA